MSRKVPSSNAYLRYSGLVFQLFVLLFAGAWIGGKIDTWLHTPDPYFTILLILICMAGFFYRLIKELNKKDED